MKKLVFIPLLFLVAGFNIDAGCKCKQRTPKQRARIKAKREERRARRTQKTAKVRQPREKRSSKKHPRKKR